jgi:hypothetical protein
MERRAVPISFRELLGEVNDGSLVLSSDPGHLLDGVFDTARMLVMLADAVNGALAQGYAGFGRPAI